jgi:uncharacterized RmlC-like cupin family protein
VERRVPFLANQKMKAQSETNVADQMDRQNPLLCNRNACGQGGVQVVNPEEFFCDREHAFRSWGVCSAACGADGISMGQGVMPPHSEGQFHAHDSETAIRIDIGVVLAEWIDEEGNVHAEVVSAGAYIHIRPGIKHRPVNRGDVPVVYTVSRNHGLAD